MIHVLSSAISSTRATVRRRRGGRSARGFVTAGDFQGTQPTWRARLKGALKRVLHRR